MTTTTLRSVQVRVTKMREKKRKESDVQKLAGPLNTGSDAPLPSGEILLLQADLVR